jgi:hypothetical protein
MNGLEPRELVDDDKTPDYIVISKKPVKLLKKQILARRKEAA